MTMFPSTTSKGTHELPLRVVAIVSSLVMILCSVPAAHAVAVIEAPGSPAGNRDDFSGTVGTRFTVGGSDVVVDALGYQDPGGDGLTLSHQVGLWRVSDMSLLAAVTVPSGAGATLNDEWRYQAIGFDLTLKAGETYTVGALVSSGSGDGWTDTGAAVAQFNLGAAFVDANPTNNFTPGGLAFPGNDGTLTDLRWAPANANDLFVSPPPSSVDAVVRSNGNAPANRDNFTGTVGTAFTLNVDKTINALGYQDSNGDGLILAHTVGLWRASDGALLASVIVPAGTGSLLDDAWRYEMLASDLTLQAGETYIVGAEVFSNSGDAWTDTGGGLVSLFPGDGVFDVNPTNRFLPGAFGLPVNNGGLLDLRWAPGNAAFITVPVPEPATAALGLLGIAALGLRRRRTA